MSDLTMRRSLAPSPSPSLNLRPGPSPSPSQPPPSTASLSRSPTKSVEKSPSKSPSKSSEEAVIPFISFSTKPDPRFASEQEESPQVSDDQSEDENLFDVPGLFTAPTSSLKKKGKESKKGKEVTFSVDDEGFPASGKGNQYLRLTPEVEQGKGGEGSGAKSRVGDGNGKSPEREKENGQRRIATVAGGILADAQARASVVADAIRNKTFRTTTGIPNSLVDPAILGEPSSYAAPISSPSRTGHPSSASRPALARGPSSSIAAVIAQRDAGYQNQFPTMASFPPLPGDTGYTFMPAGLRDFNSHFIQPSQHVNSPHSLNPQFGLPQQPSPYSLFGPPTDFGRPMNFGSQSLSTRIANSGYTSIYPPSPQRAQFANNVNMSQASTPATAPSLGDGDLPSTIEQSRSEPPPTASARPVDLNAAPGQSKQHPMTRLTKDAQHRQQSMANSASPVRRTRGRPSNASKAKAAKAATQASASTSTGNIADPSTQQRMLPRPASVGPFQAMPRSASAGPSRFMPAPGPVNAARPPINPDNPFSKLYVVVHCRLAGSDVLFGTGILAIAPQPNNDVLYDSLVTELTTLITDQKDWFGLRTSATQFARIIPATPISVTMQQILQFKRVVVRYNDGQGLDSEAEPYDTLISNTEELTKAFHLMARRNWKDVLVAFFELGPAVPAPLPAIHFEDVNGNGKHGREDEGEEGGAKRSRSGESSSIEFLETQ